MHVSVSFRTDLLPHSISVVFQDNLTIGFSSSQFTNFAGIEVDGYSRGNVGMQFLGPKNASESPGAPVSQILGNTHQALQYNEYF